jgi:hypothetical protein
LICFRFFNGRPAGWPTCRGIEIFSCWHELLVGPGSLHRGWGASHRNVGVSGLVAGT